MELQQALANVVDGVNLSREQMAAVMRQVMSGGATDAQIGGLLVALRIKGETTEEITGAAEVMRELATPVVVPRPAPSAFSVTWGSGKTSNPSSWAIPRPPVPSKTARLTPSGYSWVTPTVPSSKPACRWTSA